MDQTKTKTTISGKLRRRGFMILLDLTALHSSCLTFGFMALRSTCATRSVTLTEARWSIRQTVDPSHRFDGLTALGGATMDNYIDEHDYPTALGFRIVLDLIISLQGQKQFNHLVNCARSFKRASGFDQDRKYRFGNIASHKMDNLVIALSRNLTNMTGLDGWYIAHHTMKALQERDRE